LDIETAPAKVYAWGVYDQNIGHNQIISHPYLLCWSAKWVGRKKILSDAIINYPRFKKDKTDDSLVCKSIYELLEEADLVLAHNGDKFDLKVLNSFFLRNGFPPRTPKQSIDTVKALRREFGFLSNRLNAICTQLKIGHKVSHEGFELWVKCMGGCKKAFRTMIRYNRQDVRLLEELYLKISPHMRNHPSLAAIRNQRICTVCESKRVENNGTRWRGHGRNAVKYRRLVCRKCGHNMRETIKKTKEEKVALPTNA